MHWTDTHCHLNNFCFDLNVTPRNGPAQLRGWALAQLCCARTLAALHKLSSL